MSTDEIEDIKKLLEDHGKRISELERILASGPVVKPKGLSIKEFILQKQPDGDVQRTLVLGYYLEHVRDTSPFNVRDIEDAFREAKEPVTSNINLRVIKNIEKGFMMEAQQKKGNLKAWTLTATGEKWVETSMPARQE